MEGGDAFKMGHPKIRPKTRFFCGQKLQELVVYRFRGHTEDIISYFTLMSSEIHYYDIIEKMGSWTLMSSEVKDYLKFFFNPTDATRVAGSPRIGVGPGFDSQGSVTFFNKYCFPNLY